MEHPICPGCKQPVFELIGEHIIGTTWNEVWGEVRAPTGIWEFYCGTCFSDFTAEFAVQFEAFRRQAALSQWPAEPSAMDRLLASVRRDGETEEHWIRRHRRYVKASARVPPP